MQSEFNKLCKQYADREFIGKNISLNNVSHSRIRDLEILGETAEIGEGEKGPNNPYAIVGCSPTLKVCGKNLLDENNKFINGYLDAFNDSAEVGTQVNVFRTFWLSMPLKKGDKITISSKNNFYIVRFMDNNNIKYTSNCYLPHSWTITNDCNSIQISFREEVAGSTFTFDNLADCKIQIEKGSDATEYEPYKEQSAKMISRNIFNYSTWIDALALRQVPVYNGTLDSYTNNSITITSTSTDCYTTLYYANVDYKIYLNKNTDYILQGNISTTSRSYIMVFGCKNDSSAIVNLTPIQYADNEIYMRQFNSGDFDYYTIRCGIANSMYTATFSNIMIYEGTEMMEDTSFKDDYVLNSIDKLTDRVCKINNVWGIERNCLESTIDGSRAITIYGESDEIVGLTCEITETPVITGTSFGNNYMICDKLPYLNNNSLEVEHCCYWGNPSAVKTIKVFIKKLRFDGYNSYADYFKENPINVIVARTPVFEQIYNGGLNSLTANIPDTTFFIEDKNNLGNIKTTLQTKGQ